MANIHALRDEIVRKRVDLISALNRMHEEYPEAAYEAYTLSLMHIHDYFKGSEPGEGGVEEKSPEAK